MREFLTDPVVTGFCVGVLFAVTVLFTAAGISVLRERRAQRKADQPQPDHDNWKPQRDHNGRWV